MTAVVSRLALAPVKGMQVAPVDALDVGPLGAAGDRAFFVVDPDDAMVETARATRLLGVLPRWDGRVLTLRFPDGTTVAEEPVPGPRATTRNYDGRAIPGRRVDGTLAAAVSEHLGRPVRLLMRDADAMGPGDQPLSLVAAATVAALAPALGGTVPDARRFRMNVTLDGAGAWEEHDWAGRELAAGTAVLRGVEPVPRCVVTTLDPASGRRDQPVLKALAQLRGKTGVHLGLWCEVVAPGRIRTGDTVVPA